MRIIIFVTIEERGKTRDEMAQEFTKNCTGPTR